MMTNHFDEFSKSLAEKSVPRRQTLRLLGAAIAGALLAPLGARSAQAAGDPCKTFCNRHKWRRYACETACRACGGDTRRICTDGWSFACCASGTACCGATCRDLADDFNHCGACYHYCDPGPYENGACIDGSCMYWCREGAVDCNGECTRLDLDRYNCGACGNICPDGLACTGGSCGDCASPATNCGGYCVLLDSDPNNCGACGYVCAGGSGCYDGLCM
jgi:hypothetical protein